MATNLKGSEISTLNGIFITSDFVKAFTYSLRTTAIELFFIEKACTVEAFTESNQHVCALLVTRVSDDRIFMLTKGDLVAGDETINQMKAAENRTIADPSIIIGLWKHAKGALYNVTNIAYNLMGTAYVVYEHDGNPWVRDWNIFNERFTKVEGS